MKTRLFHLAALALGALTIVAMLLAMLPNYAAIGAGLALLIADVKKAFPSLAVLALLVLATANVTGCATVTAVETACNPSTADDVRIVGELAAQNWAAALAPEVECVIKAVVAQVLAPPSGQALASASVDMTVVRAHAAAWSLAH